MVLQEHEAATGKQEAQSAKHKPGALQYKQNCTWSVLAVKDHCTGLTLS
jgi:hypothetical protein